MCKRARCVGIASEQRVEPPGYYGLSSCLAQQPLLVQEWGGRRGKGAFRHLGDAPNYGATRSLFVYSNNWLASSFPNNRNAFLGWRYITSRGPARSAVWDLVDFPHTQLLRMISICVIFSNIQMHEAELKTKYWNIETSPEIPRKQTSAMSLNESQRLKRKTSSTFSSRFPAHFGTSWQSARACCYTCSP